MKIAWIYPHRERCGISLYSERYLDALDKRVQTGRFDPRDLFSPGADDLITEINRCDLVHIQYETSFFMNKRTDFFEKICQKISKPLIVSLHEVYRTFPGVFPREQLRGSFLTLPLKRRLYDRRHPVQTAYNRHIAHQFFANAVLVHQEFQKGILVEQDVPGEKITVLPNPVMVIPNAPGFSHQDRTRPVHLAAAGYINPHFNYDLLFSALGQLSIPWRFTWIGGVRRDEDNALLEKIRHTIRERNWRDCFQITGWLPDNEHNDLLCSTDIFCALFSSRSSSASLAAAIGCLRPVIATALPLTNELALRFGVLRCVEPSGVAVAEDIATLLANESLRSSLEKNMKEYRQLYSYASMADALIECYEKWR